MDKAVQTSSLTWNPIMYRNSKEKKKCIPLDPLAFFILHEKSDKYKWGRKYPFSLVKEDKLDMRFNAFVWLLNWWELLSDYSWDGSDRNCSSGIHNNNLSVSLEFSVSVIQQPCRMIISWIILELKSTQCLGFSKQCFPWRRMISVQGQKNAFMWIKSQYYWHPKTKKTLSIEAPSL